MTIYIDPTAPINGTGTLVSPKNTWDGITLIANETYLQKRGTVCNLPSGASKYIHVNTLTSDPGTPLTLGAYYNPDGSDDPDMPRPQIVGNVATNGAGTIFVRKSSNVLIRDLSISHVAQTTYAVAGVNIYAQHAGTYSGVTVSNCEISDHGYGIRLILSTTDDGAVLDNILLDGNDIHDNTAGIYNVFTTKLNSYIQQYTVKNNYIHDNGRRLQANIPSTAFNHSYPQGATDPTRAFKDVVIENNTVYNNEGYSIAIYNCYNDRITSRISRNHVYDNNKLELYDAHPIFVARCFGMVVEDNLVQNNSGWAQGPVGTACGIIIDTDVTLGVGGDKCIVRRNIMDGGWIDYTFGGTGNESANGQAGIFVIDNTNCLIEDNYISGFHSGIGTYSNTTADALNGLVIRGNVIVDLLESQSLMTAVGISLRAGQDTVIENNILSNCRQGIWVRSVLQSPTERNNCIHAPRNGVYYAKSATIDVSTPTVALSPTSITDNPLLIEGQYGRLNNVSPATGGIHDRYKLDADFRLSNNPRPMGRFGSIG